MDHIEVPLTMTEARLIRAICEVPPLSGPSIPVAVGRRIARRIEALERNVMAIRQARRKEHARARERSR